MAAVFRDRAQQLFVSGSAGLAATLQRPMPLVGSTGRDWRLAKVHAVFARCVSVASPDHAQLQLSRMRPTPEQSSVCEGRVAMRAG